jgi:hypothetical protein
MAKSVNQAVRQPTPNATTISRKLSSAIHRDFDVRSEKVSVSSEAVKGTKMRRLIVVSPVFRHMGYMEQQDYVWRVASRALSANELPFISMILTIDPRDLQPEPAPKRSASAKKPIARAKASPRAKT